MKKPLKTSVEGRKCIFPECKCILSIYNNEAYCHMHREQMAQKAMPKVTVNPAAAVK